MIEACEDEHYRIAPPDPIEAIKFRMAQAGLTTKDLVRPYTKPNRCIIDLPFTDKRTSIMAIISFKCKESESLFCGRNAAKFVNIRSVAERKLQQIDSAASFEFLRSPPGNRLEALSGNRAGTHSIRINDQFRICFRWTEKGVEDVEIVDYH